MNLLLLRGVDVNTPLRQAKLGRNRLPLHDACYCGNSNIVKQIVKLTLMGDSEDALDLESSIIRKACLMRTKCIGTIGGMTPPWHAKAIEVFGISVI